MSKSSNLKTRDRCLSAKNLFKKAHNFIADFHMIYTHTLHGIPLQSGDLICTTNGTDTFVAGQFWRFIGLFVPGPVDHIVIYIGPDGRCIEAGPRGVNTFEISENKWDSPQMSAQRGPLFDHFHGVVYPLKGAEVSLSQEQKIRAGIAKYCLDQAEMHKPYNFNFLDSNTEKAFYCSQLAYLAYLKFGIDLNTGIGIPDVPGTEQIIFPQEIWNGFPNILYIP